MPGRCIIYYAARSGSALTGDRPSPELESQFCVAQPDGEDIAAVSPRILPRMARNGSLAIVASALGAPCSLNMAETMIYAQGLW